MFDSPFKLKRGVVLSFPTMLRAVWMVAMIQTGDSCSIVLVF